MNLGYVGLSVLILFMAASYRVISKRFGSSNSGTFPSLGLALWAVVPICNVTTAAYGKNDLCWLTFLLVAISVPVRARQKRVASMTSPSGPVVSRTTVGQDWSSHAPSKMTARF